MQQYQSFNLTFKMKQKFLVKKLDEYDIIKI